MLLGYTFRNLIARARFVIPTMAALTLTVAAICVMVAMVGGLRQAILRSGNSTTAVVLGKNAVSESAGVVPAASLGAVKVSPGVARGASGPLVSTELVTTLSIRRDDDVLEAVPLRGVDPIAFDVHPGIKILEGRFPQEGERGVAVGSLRLGQYKHVAMGGTVRVGKKDWPVLGVFEGAGTRFGSEIWCDRRALMDDLQRTEPTVAYATLTGADAFETFQEGLTRLPDIEVISERSLRDRLLAKTTDFVIALQALILVLAIGAMFACTNAMHSAFLARNRELATLRAVGYTEGQLGTLVLQEAMFLAATSGLLGLALGSAVHGRTFAYLELGLVYTAEMTPLTAGIGLGAALIIGVCGALVPLIHVFRLDVLEVLRTG